MAQLSSTTLTKTLLAALPKATVLDDEESPKPIALRLPDIGKIRIYLWTTTPDHSQHGRPEGEYKSQVIIPSLPRSARQHFEAGDIPTFLLGFSPAFGVFVLWQLKRHQDCAYSKNLQITRKILREAAYSGWAVAAPRHTKHGPEVRCAVHPAHLVRLINAVIEVDKRNLQGQSRRIYLEAASPEIKDEEMDEAFANGDVVSLDEILNERKRVAQLRLERSNKFSTMILPLYDFSCAICEVQLHIVEAAHIVPVHDRRSLDEPWNGISLCRNHHRLYDRRIMLIDASTTVRSNKEILNVIKSEGLGNGLDTLVYPFLDRPLAVLPHDFVSSPSFRVNMSRALGLNYSMSS
ncbi:MAG: HNH endonuclease [Nitrosospira sp.]|nr:HNH endonuclease [Nitrosospira sp.]